MLVCKKLFFRKKMRRIGVWGGWLENWRGCKENLLDFESEKKTRHRQRDIVRFWKRVEVGERFWERKGGSAREILRKGGSARARENGWRSGGCWWRWRSRRSCCQRGQTLQKRWEFDFFLLPEFVFWQTLQERRQIDKTEMYDIVWFRVSACQRAFTTYIVQLSSERAYQWYNSMPFERSKIYRGHSQYRGYKLLRSNTTIFQTDMIVNTSCVCCLFVWI